MGCFPLQLACPVGGWLPADLPHAADLLSEASPHPSPGPTGRHISPGPGSCGSGSRSLLPARPDMKGRVLMALLGLYVVLVAGTQDPILKDFDFAKVAGLRAPTVGVGRPEHAGETLQDPLCLEPRELCNVGAPGIFQTAAPLGPSNFL